MPEDQDNQPLGQSITEIIDRTTAIVHEEIELAKTEIAISLQNLLRGSVAGIVGGVFAFFGLFVLLIGLSFLIGDAIGAFYPWLGFLIVAFFLFLLGGLLAVFALKNIQKGGSQLAPSQAIDEAKQTKDALAKEVQEFEGDAIEEAAPGEDTKSTEFSPPPAETHPAPDAVAEAKSELKDARTDANAAGVDAKAAKQLAKQEAKEAKEAAKAAAKAEQQAAKAEAIAAKKAKKAEKEAAKAAKQAEKNAAKAAVAGGNQEQTQQPIPPKPPAPPQPPSASTSPGAAQGPGAGQPPIPKPPPPPTGNQPPADPSGGN